MIPSGILRRHVLAAMKRIDHRKVPARRRSLKFHVVYRGRRYPPKLLISSACEFAFDRALPSSAFSGGNETNRLLKKLGFTIMEKHPPGPYWLRRQQLYSWEDLRNNGLPPVA